MNDEKVYRVAKAPDGRWGVYEATGKTVTPLVGFREQQKAMQSAKTLARAYKARLIVHGLHGNILSNRKYQR